MAIIVGSYYGILLSVLFGTISPEWNLLETSNLEKKSLLTKKSDRTWFSCLLRQETERVYSFSPGAHTGQFARDVAKK